MVYVISKQGHPLMPTKRYGFVRRTLKQGKAKVIKRCPFTIQLLYDTGSEVQDLTLGIDAGSKHIGISVTSETKEIYASEVELRNDIVNNLSIRREFRTGRRYRKTRYRKPRFQNRKKDEGWLAPSVQAKVDTHLKVIADVCKILPINEIVIETAAFDIQKIRNSEIEGVEYQQGDQLGFWNVREYVLFRDGYRCQCCKGKSKDPVLNVHHIESRKTGGDAPNNLITLCETCHRAFHKGEIELPLRIKRGMKFNDVAFMGIMRWSCYNKLKELYPNVRMTYGYITKHIRIENGLDKSHVIDARCISGHPNVEPSSEVFYMKKVRNHNRQIHKVTIGKGGYRKLNQAPKEVFGYQLFDRVLYNGKECFVFGRRLKGSFLIKSLQGDYRKEVTYKKLKKLETRKTMLVEKISVSPLPVEEGVPML